MDTRPIGVLDSGVGGLTIWKEILRELPYESTVYIGDSLNAPYGLKKPKEIRALASKLIKFLIKKKVKLIVVACNTITVNGIDVLRRKFPTIPIVGTVPVVKMAAAMTKNKKIGLLVTGATAKSTYNKRLITKFAKDCTVTIVGTNKLVPLIETSKRDKLPSVIQEELAPFKHSRVDTVILGSTHFPILRAHIQKFMGEKVMLLDSGGAVARHVRRILTNNHELTSFKKSTHSLFTTGNIRPFSYVVEYLIPKSQYIATQVVIE